MYYILLHTTATETIEILPEDVTANGTFPDSTYALNVAERPVSSQVPTCIANLCRKFDTRERQSLRAVTAREKLFKCEARIVRGGGRERASS